MYDILYRNHFECIEFIGNFRPFSTQQIYPTMASPTYDGSDVTEQNLDLYYSNLFPSDPLFQWTSYGDKERKQCAKREYSITVASPANPDGVFVRYQRCETVQDFQKLMKRERRGTEPEWVAKLDIGPIYNGDVSRHKETRLECEEKELVFDIDMDAYDDVRTCCKEKKVCRYCFKFLTAAAKVIDRSLREDFDFKHILFVFSGRRGIHCWVNDYKARSLSNSGREAVAAYLSLETAKKDSEGRVLERALMHPVFQRAAELLKDDFPKLFAKQHIFNTRASRMKLVETHFTEPALVLRSYKPDNSADDEDSWEDLLNGKNTDTTGVQRAILHYLYPRLDIEVSKQMNHLLKAPFCVHPKTGRVCVPLDVRTIDEFNPDTVPTLGQLISELYQLARKNGDDIRTLNKITRDDKVKDTSLGPYVEFFTSYVKNCLADERKRRGNTKAELF